MLRLLAILAVILGMIPKGSVNAAPAAPTAAVITIEAVTTSPEAFTMNIRLTTPPSGGLTSYRIVLNVPPALTIVGATKVGTALDGGLLEPSISGNQITIAGAIAAPINTANSIIAKLQLQILQITDDIEYTVSGSGRVNEINMLPGELVAGIARIEMTDLTGIVTSWDGQAVVGADVALNGATTALATSTDATGDYTISVGKVENQTATFVWGDAVATDSYVTEQDASVALQVAIGSSTCPIQAGDISGNGEVTEQDAARMLQIALDPGSFTPQIAFVPNNVTLLNFNADAVQDSTAYLLGDCSSNYPWIAGLTGGRAAGKVPEVSVTGDTIRLNFVDAESAKFFLNGLPQDAQLSVMIYDLARSTSEINGLSRASGNVIVAAVAEPGFILEVKVITSDQTPLDLNLSGRATESAYSDWGQVTVTPSQPPRRIFLPAVSR